MFVNEVGLTGISNGKEDRYPKQLPVEVHHDIGDSYMVEDPYGNIIKFKKTGLIKGSDIKWDHDWHNLKYGSLKQYNLVNIIKKNNNRCVSHIQSMEIASDGYRNLKTKNISIVADYVLLKEHKDDHEYYKMFCDILLCVTQYTDDIHDMICMGKAVYSILKCHYISKTDIDWVKLMQDNKL